MSSVSVQFVSTASDDLLVAPNSIIPLLGSWNDNGLYYKIDESQNIGSLFPVLGVSNSRFFELTTISSGVIFNPVKGLEFKMVNDESGMVMTKIIARSANNNDPYYIDRNGMPAASSYPYGSGDSNHPTEFFISPGDVVRGYSGSQVQRFEFTVTNENLYRFLHYGDPPSDDPPDDDPPDDDPPENDPPPTPVFVPRSARRGNLNFW